MTAVIEVLDRLDAAGVRLHYDPCVGLVVRGPRDRLPDDTVEELRGLRAQLLVAVAAQGGRELRVRAAAEAFGTLYQRINGLASGRWDVLYDRVRGEFTDRAEARAESVAARFVEDGEQWASFAQALETLEAAWRAAIQQPNSATAACRRSLSRQDDACGRQSVEAAEGHHAERGEH